MDRNERPVPTGLPVGVERVLYTAAVDPSFKEALARDRLAAVASRGFELSGSEQALLRMVPDSQLRAAIDGIDFSPENLERRRFLRTLAVTTATVVAADALTACGGDSEPTPTRGIQPDMPPADRDGGISDMMAATGIRPG